MRLEVGNYLNVSPWDRFGARVNDCQMPQFYVEATVDGSHHALCDAFRSHPGWKRLVLAGNKPSHSPDDDVSGMKNMTRAACTPMAGSGWRVAKFVGADVRAPRWIWTVNESEVDWSAVSEEQCINHFPSSGQLTTKAGLCATLRETFWWTKADVQKFYPRCYNLADNSELRAFVVDFRRSAAAAILRLHLTLCDLRKDIPCAPRIIGLAMKAVTEWISELSGGLPCEQGQPEETGEGRDKDSPSDGVTALEWAELLRYSSLLAQLADSFEVSGVAAVAAVRSFSSALELRCSSPTRRKSAPAQRSLAKGNLSLSEVATTIRSAEPSGSKSSRLMWAQPCVFDGLPSLASRAPSDASGVASLRLCSRAFSEALSRLCVLWPQAGIDGLGAGPSGLPRNTWILKAPGSSRGTAVRVNPCSQHSNE